jgi:alpha-glucosidase
MRVWKQAVIYEIYVRSFHDASGDGIGDLAGVLARLDHVRDLGADAIWLTPIHPSPDLDFGYDVLDYTSVHPALGTLDDLDRLVAAAHDAGIAVLLDWVVNHTSDRHPWFAESRASADSPRRDWYLWRAEPNNWRSRAGGSAWQRDPQTGEHYLHTFLPEQPDLNWRNPQVREAIANAMRFWLDRGIDGFRLDVLPLLIKDARFRDAPADQPRRYTVDQPEMLEVVGFLRAVADEYDGRALVAEMGLPPGRAARYHAAIDVPFNFGLITEPWEPRRLARRIAAHLDALPAGAEPNWVLGNHDVPRVAEHLGPALARVAAVLQMTLPGALTLYAGDELGLPGGPPAPGGPLDRMAPSRDPQRAPLPWDDSPHAGFSVHAPWLPSYADPALSVAAQRDDPASTLSLYRRLLALRREHRWAEGDVRALSATDDQLSYERVVDGRRHRVVASFAEAFEHGGPVLLTSRRGSEQSRGPEAVVIAL